MMVSKWQHKVVVVSGFVLSALFLWLALRQVDWKALSFSFSTIKYTPVFLCASALSIGIMMRGVRWHLIAGFPKSERHNFLRATNMGVFANMLLPARAGEFIRVITLVRLTGSSLSTPLASALIDRLVDLFVLLSTAFALFLFLPISGLLDKWLFFFAAIGCAVIVLVFLYARNSEVKVSLISGLSNRFLYRWSIRTEVFFAEFRTELRRLLSSWLSIELVFLAVFILFADYCAVLAVFQAFSLNLAFEAPLLFWVFLAVGSSLPSTPGYVGVYQIAAVWSLSFYSVPAAVSVALATTLQLVTLIVAFSMVGVEAGASIIRRLGGSDSPI